MTSPTLPSTEPALAGRLAIDGGSPVRSDALPPRIMIDEREVEAVNALMRRLMKDGGGFDRYEGPEVDLFEKELAEYFGFGYVTCVSSGSGAIHAALGALDLEPGGEVIVSSFTDPGAIMPIFFSNLVPVFAEHDYETFVMSPEGIRAAITPHTRAIIVTHLHGFVCDMDPIMAIAREHDLPVIGDASQSHGSIYKGSISAPLGDIGAMSLNAVKHITSGGQGGMVATNDEQIYWAAKRFADRGKPFGQTATSNTGLGLNYRMHELEATVGRVQLTKLESIMARRLATMRALEEGLAESAVAKPVKAIEGVVPNPWSGLFLLDLDRLTVGNDEFAAALTAEGIPTNAGYRAALIYRLQYMRELKTYGTSHFPYGFELGGRKVEWREPHNPNAERLADTLLVISIHEGWTQRDVDDAVAAFRKVEAAYRR